MNHNGFITFEGGEGSGKTTLIQAVARHFELKGQRVVATREPGGIDIAEQIREIILNRSNTAMDGRTEALLYAAARRQHWVERIKPALERGELVLCDRFIDSSLAYQGYARGLGVDEVYEINQFATEGVLPSLTLWLDLDPEAGLARIANNEQREVNRLDLERLDFHERIRQGYRLLAERFPERICRIHADQPVEQLKDEAIALIEKKWNGPIVER
ncbi:dTMP kinase [Xylanibacillus composti]|uniref:Thymidylate kinase n=1 Tax=Xylanibacillus composti TaxID=1572762 RepID=A0A8J4H0E8_9BACL|nr:dTMP kinase [Xylanibacillus composti]MDT9725172.1 dTMP kinase [Xylanibacillus composti]GIQ67255.1 thymidylate kinase [Xylanibacillus composti]